MMMLCHLKDSMFPDCLDDLIRYPGSAKLVRLLSLERLQPTSNNVLAIYTILLNTTRSIQTQFRRRPESSYPGLRNLDFKPHPSSLDLDQA